VLPAALLAEQLLIGRSVAKGLRLAFASHCGMCDVWGSECCHKHMLRHAHAARPGMVRLSIGVQHAALSLIYAGLGNGKEPGPSRCWLLSCLGWAGQLGRAAFQCRHQGFETP
jgi:hypothetical protein